MPMRQDEFVHEIARRTWNLGAALAIVPGNHIMNEGQKVSGYFDENPEIPVVAVARDIENFIPILAHEFSHLTQYVEQCPPWVAADTANDLDAWLSGKPVRGIQQQIIAIREMEADNERRTVRLLREMNAPTDIGKYCQSANSYIWFHHIVGEKRKWYLPERRPYFAPEVTAIFNTTIDKNFTKIPFRYREALLSCI